MNLQTAGGCCLLVMRILSFKDLALVNFALVCPAEEGEIQAGVTE